MLENIAGADPSSGVHGHEKTLREEEDAHGYGILVDLVRMLGFGVKVWVGVLLIAVLGPGSSPGVTR